ncbi:hypothetical protein [Clostridium cadaveris]|uniref:hypothetical protein n=1 Tax=Clostridium cadaveris TaxID=1529 RepID=UPI000400209C|nr:hypothetical protein [Clostridium cadaveris]
MKLNDKYKLGADEFNVILYERRIMEKGKAKKKEDENIEIEKVEVWKIIKLTKQKITKMQKGNMIRLKVYCINLIQQQNLTQI